VPFDVSPVLYFGFVTYYFKKDLLKMYLTIGRLGFEIVKNKLILYQDFGIKKS